MRASWPEAGPVNDILVRSSQYLTDAAHEFRLRLKSVLNAKPKVGRRRAWFARILECSFLLLTYRHPTLFDIYLIK